MFTHCCFRVFKNLSQLRLFIFLSITLLLGSCSDGGDRLEQIKAKGELVVLTRNAATTY